MLRTIFTALTLVCSLSAPAVAALAAASNSQEMPAPVEQHHEILTGVGQWEGTLTSYIPGMSADPVPAKETVEGIGGFWTQSHFECEFMGMPYVGTGCMGYDPTKGKYVGTWIDNLSSFLAVMEGDLDPETGALVMRYTARDMTGAMVPHRIETVFAGDTYTSEFFQGAGEGTKVMTIAMHRKGKKPVEAGAGK